MMHEPGRHIPIGETRLWIAEHGNPSGYPILILHGGPGLDHSMFGDYLDPLGDEYRLILVDQRAQGRSDKAPEDTWTLAQMGRDVAALADALGLGAYAVLGHSYGAFVALQNAVDLPGRAAQTIISSGVPAAHYLDHVQRSLAAFEPIELRDQVTASWARERDAQTQADAAQIMHDQYPFHFANPRDSRIAAFEARTRGTIYAPDVLRFFARAEYGGIDVEGRLDQVTSPLLVLAGRFDRTCSVEGAQAIARGVRSAELVIFEHSGHMTYAEETDAYLAAVRTFLAKNRASKR